MKATTVQRKEVLELESVIAAARQGHSLPDSERRFREMIDALPAAIYTTDAEGRLTHFNPACVAFSGRVPDLGSDQWCVTWKLYHPDGRPMPHDECPMAMALREGRAIRGHEAIAERPDGTRIWFEPYPTPLFDEHDTLVGGINMLVDITERKRATEATAKLAAIVESSDDAIIGKDLNGVITSWNGGAQRIFDYTADEAIGQPVTMLMPPDRFNEEPGILERLRRGERIDHYETVRRRKDGTLLHISLTVSPVADARGNIVGASKIARDITERKRSEERLREAKQEAEAANRAKDKFLAVLSHELRTPLTPVLMTAAAREDGDDLPPDLREDLKMIRRNVELQSRLIDDLLDLSRITSGKLCLAFDVLSINDLVRHACDTCRPRMRERGVHLYCDLDDATFDVVGDAARLQQVFWNLLNNAAKFTPAGGEVFITTENVGGDGGDNGRDDGGDRGRRVRVTVRDTGIGIPPEALGRIFDAFEQGETGITRQFGGMGLGLAICKALVEQHRGWIRADSDGPNNGSTFVVELPAASEETAAAGTVQKSGPSEREKVRPLRLLVVEDHADTAAILGRLLSASGHAVSTATTAADALKLAGERVFDIVVSDLGLPDMTGYDLMRQINQRRATRGIAMSGYGMEDDIRKSAQAGFSEHLVKPVSVAQLEQAIRRVAGNNEAA